MSVQKTLKNYVIVQFINRGMQAKIKILEIVPCTWVYEDKSASTNMKCFYPPPPYDSLENIIKNLDDPDKESWKSYTVLCLLNADKYDDALKLLEKLKEKNVDDLTFSSFSESDLGPQGTELETCIKRNQLKQRQEEMSSNFNKKTLQYQKKRASSTAVDHDQPHKMYKILNNDVIDNTSDGPATSETQELPVLQSLVNDSIDIDASLNNDPATSLDVVSSLKADIQDLKLGMSELKKDVAECKDQNSIIINNLKKLMVILKKNQQDSSCQINSESLVKQYSSEKKLFEIPVKTLDNFKNYENVLKENKDCFRETKIVMKSLITGVTDAKKGIRHIAKNFLTHDVTSNFVVQRITKLNNKQTNHKQILKITHPKFLEAITSVVKKEYSIPEDSVLSLLGNIFARSAEWGQIKISNTLSDDLDDSDNE